MPDPILKFPADYETRNVSEVRAGDADDPPGTFTGYASVFWVVDDYLTAFAPKAFRKSIADRAGRVPMLWFHDPEKLIGPVTALSEDKRGLSFKARAGETNWGAMLRDQLAMGTDHVGLSHGFRRVKDRSAEDGDPLDFTALPDAFKTAKAGDVRIITEASVLELSSLPWAFASNGATSVDSARARQTAAIAGQLSSLTDAIRAGSVSPAQWTQLVAAWEARDGAGPADTPPTPTVEPLARRRTDIDVAIALAKHRGWLTVGVSA